MQGGGPDALDYRCGERVQGDAEHARRGDRDQPAGGADPDRARPNALAAWWIAPGRPAKPYQGSVYYQP